MIKNITAYSFILLSNIVLLAHAVIPHHQHESDICIVNSHCQTDSGVHKHSDVEHNHEHDGENENNCCVLSEVVLLPPKNTIKKHEDIYCQENHLVLNKFQAVLFSNELQAFDSVFITNAFGPLITCFHTHFVNTALGLRAPPVV
jgi:hypothetical protein